ncbi:MAG: energy transducer TonB [Tannerellaceae bacterium]|nr:energy transducer TonB [Tannerellaceae bacterium]
MKLPDYIKGNRRGKEANRLEREALTDPFLSDALDGYMELQEDPTLRIEQMRNRVTARTTGRKDRFRFWSAAAVLVAILTTGTIFFMRPVNDADIYFSLNESDLLFEDVFDTNYTFEDALAEVHTNQQTVQTEPLPLFTFPLPIGGEKYIEPYMEIITGEYDIMNINIPEVKQGVGRKPEPAVNGGSYIRYLANHIQIPIQGACAATKGRVTVSFRVNPAGRPYDIRVVKGLCESLDNEAVRLVREGPDWKFGDQEVKMTIQL